LSLSTYETIAVPPHYSPATPDIMYKMEYIWNTIII